MDWGFSSTPQIPEEESEPANEEIDPGAAGGIYSPRQTNRASRVEGGTDTTPPGEREGNETRVEGESWFVVPLAGRR